ncbi:orexin receptor type 2-like, partial [Physella acuta]|uniref:orexin receptor type 2-like n=1 Tax=Physella acuta TaxID=109671 RepID=UPI0027DCE1AF
MATVAVIVSVLTLTSISIERWFAICQPLTFQQTKSRVIICVAVIWIVAHVAAIPRLIVMQENHDALIPPNLTILLTSCGPRDLDLTIKYEIFLVVTFFVIPIIVMGYNYTAIAVCLWSSSRNTRHLTEGDQQAIVSQLMARRRTAKMLVVVVIVFFFCFLPNHIWNILRHLVSVNEINELAPVITLLTQVLVYTNSCTNPIIYNFMS